MSTRGWLSAALLGWGVLTAFRGALRIGAEWRWALGEEPTDMWQFEPLLHERGLAEGAVLLLSGLLVAFAAPRIARWLFGDHDTPPSRPSLGLVSVIMASAATLAGCVALLGPSLAIRRPYPSLTMPFIGPGPMREPRHTGTWVLAAVALSTVLTISLLVRRRGDPLQAAATGSWPAVRAFGLVTAGVLGSAWAIAGALNLTAARLFGGRGVRGIEEVFAPSMLAVVLVGAAALVLLRAQRARMEDVPYLPEYDVPPTLGHVRYGVWSCVGAYALLVAAATLLLELAGWTGLLDPGSHSGGGDAHRWWVPGIWLALGAIAWLGLRGCARIVRGLPHRPRRLDPAPIARTAFEPLLWAGAAAWTFVGSLRVGLGAWLDGQWAALDDATYVWALQGAAAVHVAILAGVAWFRGWRPDRAGLLAIELGAAVASILAVPAAAGAISDAMTLAGRAGTSPSWTAIRVVTALMHVAVPLAVILASRCAAHRWSRSTA